MNELVTKADLALALDSLTLALDNLKLELTIRFGSLIAAAIITLAVLQRIH
jgi:hypothetical protein